MARGLVFFMVESSPLRPRARGPDGGVFFMVASAGGWMEKRQRAAPTHSRDAAGRPTNAPNSGKNATRSRRND